MNSESNLIDLYKPYVASYSGLSFCLRERVMEQNTAELGQNETKKPSFTPTLLNVTSNSYLGLDDEYLIDK